VSINGLIFFEARRHVGSSGFILYVQEERDGPRERKDFGTEDELIKYLRGFELDRVTPTQVSQHLKGPPQKDTNPPGTKLIFTGRRKA